MSEVTVLFVCSANMCRSPMAEGIARQLLTEKGCDQLEVSSAGTHGFRGYPAVDNAIKAMAEIGIDIQEHRSSDLYPSVVREKDVIVVMSPHHAQTVVELESSASKKLVMLWQYADRADVVDEIRDPVGQELQAFIECRTLLQRCITNWLEHVLNS